MTLKAVIEDSNLPPYIASISVFDENGRYVDGFEVTAIEDKRNISDEECQKYEKCILCPHNENCTRDLKDTGVLI